MTIIKSPSPFSSLAQYFYSTSRLSRSRQQRHQKPIIEVILDWSARICSELLIRVCGKRFFVGTGCGVWGVGCGVLRGSIT
ncbi:hypothetical protein [Microcystis aeruginosa]|uniref:hypothetical protein n=1 Tax=Microcystis aeruginosa TaxID=1126 RepID=UPI001330CDB7|nr:hypothetical protein [Microcystis aeruginosa]